MSMGRITKSTLSEQLAAALRADILAGTWKKRLPGYRVLGAHYGLSRPTCLAALRILAWEGLISGGGARRRWTIVSGNVRRRPKEGVAKSGLVLWLDEDDSALMDPATAAVLAAGRDVCAKQGTTLRMKVGRFALGRGAGAAARRLIEGYLPARVVLHNAPKSVVEAFLRTGLPVYMLGGEVPAHGAVEGTGQSLRKTLEMVVARLLGMGRRRILVPLPAGREGWRRQAMDVLQASGRAPAGEVESWVPAIRDVFPGAMLGHWRRLCRELEPDAIVVNDATWLLSLYSVAWEMGRRPGRDILAVTTDSPEWLRWLEPAPVMLRFPSRRMQRHFVRWLRRPDPARGYHFLTLEWPETGGAIGATPGGRGLPPRLRTETTPKKARGSRCPALCAMPSTG